MSAALKAEPTHKLQIEVGLPLRDQLHLDLEVDSQRMIVAAKLTGRGCLPFLELLVTWRPKLKGSLDALQIPDGDGHSAILLREAILKVQGRWFFPYGEEELCHCRAIPTAKVDAAIVGGCKNVKSVSRETSAGTSCGTCRTDIEAIIKYRHAK